MATTMKKHTSIEPVVSLLAKIGFKKRAGDVFTLDLAPGILGWLGLNRATQNRAPKEVEINPVVGVRFQDVERLVAECRGEEFHAYQPPTISVPLGYLTPENKYKAWVFTPGRSADVAIDMVNLIDTHGIAFMHSVASLDELRRRLQDHFGFEHHWRTGDPRPRSLRGTSSRRAPCWTRRSRPLAQGRIPLRPTTSGSRGHSAPG